MIFRSPSTTSACHGAHKQFLPRIPLLKGSSTGQPHPWNPIGRLGPRWKHPSIDQITTNNSVSPTHSLVLQDLDPNNYGEWYLSSPVNLAGLVSAGDAIDIQWFQIYSVTNGSMRLSFAFLNKGGVTLTSMDFNTSSDGTNTGWAGTVAASSFEEQYQQLIVPADATQLRVNFASGGASSVTGIMVIDDLSVRRSVPQFTAVTPQSGGFNLTWYSRADKTYTVLFTDTLSPAPAWTPLATGIPGDFPTVSYLDSVNHGANQGYYLIMQE